VIRAIGILLAVAFVMSATALIACTKTTTLSPRAQELIIGAMRDNAFGVTRLDGGAPSANRALDHSSCLNLAAVLQEAKVADAGVVCP
jgi:hypothetical protein